MDNSTNMSDDLNDDIAEASPVTEPASGDGVAVRQLREWGNRLEADLYEARRQLRDQAFQLAGFNPSEGPGKLLAQAYQGEPTAEAVKAFAAEYGLTPAAAPTEPAAAAPPAPSPRLETQERMGSAMAAAEPVAVDDLVARIEQAETAVIGGEGSVLESIGLKLQYANQRQ